MAEPQTMHTVTIAVDDEHHDTHPIDGLRDGTVPAWLQTTAAVGWRLLIVIAAIVALGAVFSRFQVIIVPLLVAMLIAAAFAPPVRWLAGRGLPPLLATWIMILVSVAFVAGSAWLLTPPLVAGFSDLGSAVTEAYGDVKVWLVEGPLGLDQADVDDTEAQIVDRVTRVVETDLPSRAGLLVEILTGFFLTLVIAFFYVKDANRFRDGFVRLFPKHDRRRALAAFARAWLVLRRYLLGVVVVGAADAIIIGIGLAIIGVPHVIPVMVITFLAAFFPLVGAIFAGGVAALLALASGGLTDALLVIGLTIVVQQLDGDLIAPMVYSRAVNLHPLTVLIALTAGTVLAGIVGAFLAVPVLAVVTATTAAWREEGEVRPEAAPTNGDRSRSHT